MKIDNTFDIKLLIVFQALIEKRQVSAAAEHLGMGQPAVSRALSRLRQHFDDPLFVRIQNRMEPTARATQLTVPIREMLRLYEHSLSAEEEFRPANSHRIFRIAGTDVSQVLLFSQIGKQLFKRAPNVKLQAIPLGQESLPKLLESEADVAFGPYPKLYAGIHERTVFKEKYVCLVRRDHPTIQSKLTLSQFEQSNHILASAHRWGHMHEQMESQIISAIPPGKLKMIMHNFLSAALLVESSDMIVTVPTGLAQALSYRKGFRVLEPPIDLPQFDVKLYWHERFHNDTAHIWFRNLVYECFKGITGILEQPIV